MKDLISKADVLETYAELYDTFEDNQFIRKELNKVYDKLNGLPYAPPEPCEDAVSRKAVYEAMVEKGQRSRRYRLGETWKLNGTEIRETLDTVPSVTLKSDHSGDTTEMVEYDDCISRQAVADVAYEVGNLFDGEDDTRTPYGVAFDIQMAVDKLPSVTPKPEPCDDAVSRKSILEKISKKDNWEKYDRYNIGLSDARRIVQDEPPVTPKRKTGKWLDNYQYGYKCSECGAYLEIDCGDVEMNFCPNCNADMRGKQDE